MLRAVFNGGAATMELLNAELLKIYYPFMESYIYSQDAEERTRLALVSGFDCSLIFKAL